MKKLLKNLCATSLALSLSGCVSVAPNIEVCSPLTDPTDYSVEKHAGFCRYTLSGEERTIYGEDWLRKVRTGVVIDMDNWVKMSTWAKKECRKHNNECVDKK